MKLHLLSLSALVLLGASSCTNSKEEKKEQRSYFDISGMDTTVKPGDDFFQYANGGWMKTAVIPDDQSGWGSFYTLYEENLQKLKGILEEAAQSKSAKGSIEQKLGDYYASGMDTVAIDKLGAAPLKPALEKMDAVKDYKELVALVTEMYSKGEDYFIGMYVGADEKNSARNVAVLYQAGTSLPEKDYYTRTDSASVATREAFLAYVEKMFTLTGVDAATAQKNAKTILALETEIAKSHRTAVELRNPQANYNKMSLNDL